MTLTTCSVDMHVLMLAALLLLFWSRCSVKAGKCLPFERFLLYTARSAVQPGLHRFAASKSTGERRDVVSPPPQRTSVELEIDTRPRGQSKVGESDGANSSAAAAASVPRHSPSKISNARDPGFVAEFYNNSRLHYLSTWGAEFRQYVNELHTRGSHSFPGKERLEQIVAASASDSLSQKETIAKGSRVIMHIDMDCFFVSVGLRKRPDLVGTVSNCCCSVWGRNFMSSSPQTPPACFRKTSCGNTFQRERAKRSPWH